MSSLHKQDTTEMLGVTPLAGIQDSEVWKHLLTPQVKALIGTISRYGQPQVFETIVGHFPADRASNLNLHELNASSGNYVRFPYLSTLHRTEYGALVIKRDGVKVKAMCWVGDVFQDKAELVYAVALRDRRFDGTKRGNDSALLFYPYDHPTFHKPLIAGLRSAEVSIYSFSPGSRIVSATGEMEFERFIEKPFCYLEQPEIFLKYFHRAWETDRAPGQFAAPIPDVSRKSLQGIEYIASRHGYDLLECATSHYHVARWFQSRHYRYSYKHDEETLGQLATGVERVRAALKLAGKPLRRTQESWVAVIQSLRPAELIPQELSIGGPVWPQDNISPQVLWMNKPLTEKAAQAVSGPTSL